LCRQEFDQFGLTLMLQELGVLPRDYFCVIALALGTLCLFHLLSEYEGITVRFLAGSDSFGFRLLGPWVAFFIS
jgi:hypothetical protein